MPNEIEAGTTLLEALESSISAGGTSQEPVTPAPEANAATSTATTATETPDPEAIDPQWSPGAQERIRALIAERNAAREHEAAAKAFESWKPLIERMQAEGGYNSFADFEADQKRIAEEQAEQTKIQDHLRNTANDLMKKVNEGYVDPHTGQFTKLDMQTAERLFELEKQSALTAATTAKQQERLISLELDQLKAKPEYEHMDADWVRAVAKANPTIPIEKIALDSHKREAARIQDVITKYNTGKAVDEQNTRQQPASGGSMPTIGGAPDPSKDPVGYAKWMDDEAARNSRR